MLKVLYYLLVRPGQHGHRDIKDSAHDALSHYIYAGVHVAGEKIGGITLSYSDISGNCLS